MLAFAENIFSDNRKIGILLVILGIVLLVMGVVLLFDPVLLAMGNLLFMGGMPFIFGFIRSLRFFNPFERSSKWKGVISFFGGIVLVMLRWPIIGMVLELFGMIRLFGSYFPIILSFIRQIPVVGSYIDRIPYIKDFVTSAAKQSPKYPNV